jgi:hypothetical protein
VETLRDKLKLQPTGPIEAEDRESIAPAIVQSAENKQRLKALFERMIEQSHLWEDA